MKTHNVIIDTDPGLDDAIAMLLALAYPEACDLRAVTTVAGNQTIEKVTDNACRLLAFAGSRVPVAAGAAAPLERELVLAANVHGETGLGDIILPEAASVPAEGGAQRLLVETLEAAAEPATIVAIGPETNIAILLSGHPELKRKIGLISLMGGSLSSGNVTPAAEFNIFVDPEAARTVFASGIPLVMSGLDVTLKAYLAEDEVGRLRKGGAASRLVADLLGCYALRYSRIGMPGPAIHDACSIAYLIRPEIFSGEDLHVEVETKGEWTRGMTVADRRRGSRGRPNVHVLVDLDRAAFASLLLEGFERLDRRIASLRGA